MFSCCEDKLVFPMSIGKKKNQNDYFRSFHKLCVVQNFALYTVHCNRFLVSDNPKQSSQIPVFIRILDINDHAPEFAKYYETFVCENAKAGQVSEYLCYLRILVKLLRNIITETSECLHFSNCKSNQLSLYSLSTNSSYHLFTKKKKRF